MLRNRIYAVAAAALVPGILMLVGNELWVRQERVAEVQSQTLRQARLVSIEFDRILDGLNNVLLVVSASRASEVTSIQDCNTSFAEIVSRVPAIDVLAEFNAAGTAVCASNPEAVGLSIADKSYFKEAVSTGKLSVGVFDKNRSTGRNVLPVAISIDEKEGMPRRILAASLQLDWIGERIRERGLLQGGAVTVADRDGVIIVREPFAERFVGTRIPDPFLGLVTASGPGTQNVLSQDGTQRIIGYYPVSEFTKGLYVSVGTSTLEAFARVNRQFLFATLSIVIGAALSLGWARYVGRVFLQRPVRRLVETVEAWRAGDITKRTGVSRTAGELGLIAAALDDMMHDFERHRIDQEIAGRELVHRVKNTLAIIQAMTRQTFYGPEHRAAKAVFSKRIDALAGTYDALFAQNWTGADFQKTIEQTLAPHDDGCSRFRMQGPPIELPAPAVMALSMIIHELATNAVKYGAIKTSTGTVDIAWRWSDSNRQRVCFSWLEAGGPEVVKPTKTGFGSKLISIALGPDFSPSTMIDYLPGGLSYRLEFTIVRAASA